MKNLFIVEDHDAALVIWRKQKVKAIDLVHIDAHIDFGYHMAQPIAKIFKEARSKEELKRNLELTLSYMRYERDLGKQLNIGNYIYPAMQEGIIKNFYWVIPGDLKEFARCSKRIKDILTKTSQQSMPAHKKPKLKIHIKSGIIKAALFGRRFTVCCLGTLPTLRKSVLMDIDTDFLVIDSIRNASNTQQIAKRRPWISPKELANILKKKIKKPKVITVSYSVNGGWTPMRYKYLGDEIARYMGDKDPGISKRLKAAERFNVFLSSSDKKYYRQAIELNPLYRREDNNYGTLYLAKKKFALARKEFLKILNVDPQNPGSLLGMGSIALKKSGLDDAKRYFRRSLRYSKGRLLSRVYNKAMLGLAEAEFRLGNFKTARKLLTRHQKLQPFTPTSYLLLARIFEKERNFNKAADYYKDSINLGALSPVPLARLLKISKYIKARDRIAEYVKKKRRLLKNMGMTGRR